MTDLATDLDIEVRLGRSLSDVEAIRVVPLLQDASASIRNYTRQTISEVTGDIIQVKVRAGRVRLPQRPVTAVTSVVSIAGDPVLYLWPFDDTVIVGTNTPDAFAWVPWLNGTPAVIVQYSHGWNPVPDDIVGVCCSIVLRALGRDPVDAGLQSEQIAGYSYTMGSAAAAGAFGMLQAERDILDAYVRHGGQIDTSPRMIV